MSKNESRNVPSQRKIAMKFDNIKIINLLIGLLRKINWTTKSWKKDVTCIKFPDMNDEVDRKLKNTFKQEHNSLKKTRQKTCRLSQYCNYICDRQKIIYKIFVQLVQEIIHDQHDQTTLYKNKGTQQIQPFVSYQHAK